MYAEQLECATNGDSGIQVIKEFEKLERKGATPCSWCGDVFPTHQPVHCPNHPYLNTGDQGFKASYEARAATVLEQLQVVASKITGEESANAACPSCTELDDHHNWRSCLKSMKCYKNLEGHWEMEPPGDPQELPEEYQSTPCENCCVVVPNHFTGNCPHPESRSFGVRFTLMRGEEYISLIRTSRRSYLNRITDEEELCLVCNWFLMRDEGGVITYHNPEQCLKKCRIVLKEQGDQWKKTFHGEGEASPLGLCAGREHAHDSWQEYKKCYAEIQRKCNLWQELHVLRGAKAHGLYWVCADIFVDHDEAQCPVGPGSENPTLLSFWDNPIESFVRVVGTMVEWVRGVQTGPCPLCNVQEDQHDYAVCLRTAKFELKEGTLNVTTGQRRKDNPSPNPNPTGPTPGTTPQVTPKTPQPTLGSESPGKGTTGKEAMMRG